MVGPICKFFFSFFLFPSLLLISSPLSLSLSLPPDACSIPWSRVAPRFFPDKHDRGPPGDSSAGEASWPPAPCLFRPPPCARPPTAMGLLCPELDNEPLSASSTGELSHAAQGQISPARSQGWPTRWCRTSLTLPLPPPAPPGLRAPPPLPRPRGMAGGRDEPRDMASAGAHPHVPPLAASARLPCRGSSQGG